MVSKRREWSALLGPQWRGSPSGESSSARTACCMTANSCCCCDSSMASCCPSFAEAGLGLLAPFWSKRTVTSGIRNQMQTRIMQNRCIYLVRSQKPGYQKFEVQKHKARAKLNVSVKTRYQNYASIRQGLGRIRIKTKGCCVQFLNRLAYK